MMPCVISFMIAPTDGVACLFSEAPQVTALIMGIEGVTEVAINALNKVATINHNPQKVSSEQLLEQVNASGTFKGSLGNASKISKTKITIDGMCCSSEVPQVMDLLEKVPGVIKVVVSEITKEATVEHDSAIISSQGLVDKFKGTAFAGSTLKSSEGGQAESESSAAAWPKWNVTLLATTHNYSQSALTLSCLAQVECNNYSQLLTTTHSLHSH